MATFYLIRHGTTNAGEVLVSRSPGIGMSEYGANQVEKVSNYLADVDFNEIHSSPLERTRIMAEAIAKKQNKSVIYSDLLLELEFGEWTNKSFKELESDQRWKTFHTFRSGTRAPKGELILEVQHRMIKRIEEIFNSNPTGTYAIVSHGDPIRTAIAYYAGIHLENMLKITVGLASINIIYLDEWGSRLDKLNFTI